MRMIDVLPGDFRRRKAQEAARSKRRLYGSAGGGARPAKAAGGLGLSTCGVKHRHNDTDYTSGRYNHSAAERRRGASDTGSSRCGGFELVYPPPEGKESPRGRSFARFLRSSQALLDHATGAATPLAPEWKPHDYRYNGGNGRGSWRIDPESCAAENDDNGSIDAITSAWEEGKEERRGGEAVIGATGQENVEKTASGRRSRRLSVFDEAQSIRKTSTGRALRSSTTMAEDAAAADAAASARTPERLQSSGGRKQRRPSYEHHLSPRPHLVAHPPGHRRGLQEFHQEPPPPHHVAHRRPTSGKERCATNDSPAAGTTAGRGEQHRLRQKHTVRLQNSNAAEYAEGQDSGRGSSSSNSNSGSSSTVHWDYVTAPRPTRKTKLGLQTAGNPQPHEAVTAKKAARQKRRAGSAPTRRTAELQEAATVRAAATRTSPTRTMRTARAARTITTTGAAVRITEGSSSSLSAGSSKRGLHRCDAGVLQDVTLGALASDTMRGLMVHSRRTDGKWTMTGTKNKAPCPVDEGNKKTSNLPRVLGDFSTAAAAVAAAPAGIEIDEHIDVPGGGEGRRGVTPVLDHPHRVRSSPWISVAARSRLSTATPTGVGATANRNHHRPCTANKWYVSPRGNGATIATF